MIINLDSLQILRLLQITSPTLPIGAYSYSEGIEYLCSSGVIHNEVDLYNWLKRELSFGFISNEAAIALRAHQGFIKSDIHSLIYWNNWFSATRETEEVRLASWQMGQSLIKLWCQLPLDSLSREETYQDSLKENLQDFQSLSTIRQEIQDSLPKAKDNAEGRGCNYAIAFGIVAASLGINPQNTVSGYIYSWLSNLVSAAVRAVPFGQTIGQQIIFRLSTDIVQSSQLALERLDCDLEWCGWGASLASANHETQYSRLFRS
ncbi:urease accessory protein UreF [Pseudanabaena sp. FACHB-1998]|uniref:urease accessory protein UreF n=1 Tax=Pseudanabaena sp. FACHB-1998 TaxID=2692858 RepID=UPI001680FF5B|nr:urease accessory protein UreF [Pseudanabaena sp. FACHB-1998]MBD2176333.1 urease accessory protein UreF [Pseudanabaena sp. FACHB-1998]